MNSDWLVLIESNTTGSGRLFCSSARQHGLRPVVFVRDPARYPYLAVDGIEVRVLDTGKPAELYRGCLALPGRLAGVTSSSEYFIAAASELAARFGLPHPDPAAVTRCRDKGLQRSALLAAGLPSPRFGRASTPATAVDQASRLGWPVVVKPCTGSGSVGVRRCSSAAEVWSATGAIIAGDPAALGIPKQQAVLVEQYLDGPECSVEIFDWQIVGVTAKRLGPEPYFVEVGHDFPAQLSNADWLAVTEMALAALAALGLGWGAAHVELRLTGAGPRIVEVNPRLAGGLIPRLVQQATGIDLIALVVSRAAGLDTAVRPSQHRAASIRFCIAEQNGTLDGANGFEQIRSYPGIVEAELTGVLGGATTIRHSFQDRLGYLLSTGADARAAAHNADRALARVELLIAPAREDFYA